MQNYSASFQDTRQDTKSSDDYSEENDTQIDMLKTMHMP
jgi:hypothetical protein